MHSLSGGQIVQSHLFCALCVLWDSTEKLLLHPSCWMGPGRPHSIVSCARWCMAQQAGIKAAGLTCPNQLCEAVCLGENWILLQQMGIWGLWWYYLWELGETDGFRSANAIVSLSALFAQRWATMMPWGASHQGCGQANDLCPQTCWPIFYPPTPQCTTDISQDQCCIFISIIYHLWITTAILYGKPNVFGLHQDAIFPPSLDPSYFLIKPFSLLNLLSWLPKWTLNLVFSHIM